jgi:adenylosuccinate lyase
MALGKAGADRQEMHENLRKHALLAWDEVQKGQENPLAENLRSDPIFTRFLDPQEIMNLMRVEDYVGDAPDRALRLANEIRSLIR